MPTKRGRSTPAKEEYQESAVAETSQGRPDVATQRNLFAGLCIGKPLHHHNLTLFPLSWCIPTMAPTSFWEPPSKRAKPWSKRSMRPVAFPIW